MDIDLVSNQLLCKVYGGLGNQLFQIFTSLATSIKYNLDVKFNGFILSHNRPLYWDNLLKSVKYKTISQLEWNQYSNCNIIKDTYDYSYKPIIIKENSITILDGYFQNYLYFNDYSTNIVDILDIKNQQKYVNSLIPDISQYISLHFRMGDYKNLPQYHPIQTNEYYITAIKLIANKYSYGTKLKVLYFCENEDIEIVKSRLLEIKTRLMSSESMIIDFFKLSDLTNSKNITDWVEMLIMSLCSDNIIGNSTFSWWAAYLNPHLDKMVICPSNWFGVSISHLKIDGFILPGWKQV